MTNLSVIECENEVLRAKYAVLKGAAQALVNTVEAYMKQACLRSDLYNVKENLKELLR